MCPWTLASCILSPWSVPIPLVYQRARGNLVVMHNTNMRRAGRMHIAGETGDEMQPRASQHQPS